MENTHLKADAERYARLRVAFEERFGHAPARARLFSSPGRAEIVGNHTDHNRGKVIVAALSCSVLCLAEPRADGVVEICSAGFRPIRFSIADTKRREGERGKSPAFARGVLHYLKGKGLPVGGFSAVTESNIFRGAGVSSSAAFSVLVAEVENELYLGGRLTPLEKAVAAQYAENEFFGKPCGLLDQTGIALGGLNEVDFCTDTPAFRKLPPPKGYSVVLTATGGSHAELTAHYAAVRNEMGEVAAYFHKKYLREAALEDVMRELPALRKRVSDRAVLRALHFFEENARVERAAEGLLSGEIPAFLAAVRESGESSLRYLQNCSVPGSVDQPLVMGLKLTEMLIKRGAFRMMGGGFTGTVLAIVPDEDAKDYGAQMARVFGKESVFYADLREYGTCELQI